MNHLAIPPSANWYLSSILACSPDNTVVYGSRNDIVLIIPVENRYNIRLIKAHHSKITSVHLNRNWNKPNKYCVSTSEDKLVSLWDLTTFERKSGHNNHLKHDEVVVGADFAGEERVISVAETGRIVIWHIISGQETEIKDILTPKAVVTTLSVCPHAPWLAAFGMKNGLINIVDLRRNGKLLYKLRGHDKTVLSLSWCPVPENIFPRSPGNIVRSKGNGNSNVDYKITREKSEETVAVDKKHNIGENGEIEERKLNHVTSSTDNNTKNDGEFHPEKSKDEPQNNGNIQDDVHVNIEENHKDKVSNEDCDHIIEQKTEVGDDNEISDVIKALEKVSVENVDAKKHEDVKEDSDIDKTQKMTSATIAKNTEEIDLSKQLSTHIEDSQSIDNEDCDYITEQKTEVCDDNEISNVIKALEKVSVENVDAEKREDVKEDIDIDKTQKMTSATIAENTEEIDISKQSPTHVEDSQSIDNEDCDYITEQKTEVVDNEISNVIKGLEKVSVENVDAKKREDIKEDIDIDKTQNVTSATITGNNIKEINVSEQLPTHEDSQSLDTGIKGVPVVLLGEETIENVTLKNNDNDKIVVESAKKPSINSACENETDESTKEVQQIVETILNNVETKSKVTLEEEPRKEFLLASSGRDSNIYIWRAGTDGRMQTFLSLHGGRKVNKFKSNNDNTWIVVHWVSPNCLLSSSKNGSLLSWTLPRPLSAKNEPRTIHDDHKNVLFSIAGPARYFSKIEMQPALCEMNAWTVGPERCLFNTSLGADRKNLAAFYTFGGLVNQMSVSPITPTRLALAMSDSEVRVWELSNANPTNLQMVRFTQKIQSTVNALAWHPVREFHLAYGTAEGRIGIIDTSNPSRPPRLLQMYCKNIIHKLEWGPSMSDKEKTDNHWLYASSEGSLVAFDVNDSTLDPFVLAMPLNKMYAYNFSWKPDYSMLVVSIKSGELLIYSPSMELLHTIYLQKKGFAKLVWHPYASMSDAKNNPMSCWFAVSINGDSKVYIYDVSKLMDKENEEDRNKPELTFEGHAEVITCLAWDFFDGKKLIAGSDEGIVQIWDVTKNELIATYVEPYYEAISSAIWSPLDADYVISASRSCMLTVWKVSENPPRNDTDIFKERKKFKNALRHESNSLMPKASKSVTKTKDGAVNLKKKFKNSLFSITVNPSDGSECVSDLRNLIAWKTSDPANGVKHEKQSKHEAGNNDKFSNFSLLNTKDEVLRLFNANDNILKKHKYFDTLALSSLWKGDIGEYITKSVEEKIVTPRMIALAPMVSTRLWQNACLTYAEQMKQSAQTNPLEVAMYYLACHKVEEAILALCDNDLYKEAISLAKCRLSENDPLVDIVLERWSRYAHKDGDYETTAACQIALGHHEEAARTLFRRSNDVLNVALELAELSGNKELQEAISFRCKAFNMEEDKPEVTLPSRAEAFLNSITKVNSSSSSVSELPITKNGAGDTLLHNGEDLEANLSSEID